MATIDQGNHEALGASPLVERAINRSLADRYAQAAEEIQLLLRAAHRVMEREGTFEPTIRDVLREANVGTQVFYRHFSSKDALLLVIFDDRRRALARHLAAEMSSAADPPDRIRVWIEGVVAESDRVLAASRKRPFMACHQRLAEQFPNEELASTTRLTEPLVAALRAGGETGWFETDNPERAAWFIYRLTNGIVESHVLHRTTPPAEEVAALVAFCLHAVRHTGSPT